MPNRSQQPWTIHRKKDLSRKKYYYNKITKETTWSRPSTLGPESQDDSYYEKVDKRSGKTYYVCLSSKQTTWKLPEEGHLVEAPKRETQKKVIPTKAEKYVDSKKKVKNIPPRVPEFNSKNADFDVQNKPPPIPTFASTTFTLNQFDMPMKTTTATTSLLSSPPPKPQTKIYNDRLEKRVSTFRGDINEAITCVENILSRLGHLSRVVRPSSSHSNGTTY